MTDTSTTPRLTAEFPEGWMEAVSAPIASAVAERIRGELGERTRSPYLTVREAAEYIRAKPHRIYHLLSARVIQRYRDGKRVLIRRDELDRYLASLGPSALARRRLD
jgi:excisionase family DNA binding protein